MQKSLYPPAQVAFHCGPYHMLPEKNLVFDLAADPEERNHLSLFSIDFGIKSLARRVSEKYLESYAALHEIIAPAGGASLGVDEETLKQLRALGYID